MLDKHNTFKLVFLVVPNLQYSSVASTTQVQTDLETGAKGMYAPGPLALWVSTSTGWQGWAKLTPWSRTNTVL